MKIFLVGLKCLPQNHSVHLSVTLLLNLHAFSAHCPSAHNRVCAHITQSCRNMCYYGNYRVTIQSNWCRPTIYRWWRKPCRHQVSSPRLQICWIINVNVNNSWTDKMDKGCYLGYSHQALRQQEVYGNTVLSTQPVTVSMMKSVCNSD